MKSCISKRPEILQRPQFIRHAKVNGKGMQFAFLVAITFLKVDNGLANNMMQKRTPSFPIKSSGSGAVKDMSTIKVASRELYRTCSDTVPGSSLAFGSQKRVNW